MVKISELSDIQKQHLAWRLDNKTGCGLLTACSIARGEHGDLNLVYVFVQYGGRTRRSAIIHARKVMEFKLPNQGDVLMAHDQVRADFELDHPSILTFLEWKGSCYVSKTTGDVTYLAEKINHSLQAYRKAYTRYSAAQQGR